MNKQTKRWRCEVEKKNLTLQILYLRFTEISSPGAYLSRIMTLVIQLAVLNCGQI